MFTVQSLPSFIVSGVIIFFVGPVRPDIDTHGCDTRCMRTMRKDPDFPEQGLCFE
jgi:hypothetical protein